MTSQLKAYEGNEPYIFISYAHKDTDRVFPIIQALQSRGFRVWYDGGIEAGTEWPEYIAEHLDGCSCFLAFLSQNSLESHNCRREINFAIELRKEPLVVHLEEVQMSLGMRMQLGTLQAIFYYRHSNDASFLEALTAAEKLRLCQSAAASVKETPPAQTPSAREHVRKGDAASEAGNQSEAFSWYKKAADLGDAEGQFHLAECYYHGKGVFESKSEAIRLWKLAAAQGDSAAQNSLGVCYYQGDGVTLDYWEAVRLFRLAMEGGSVKAVRNLALAYRDGKGVLQDHRESVRLMRIAATKGHVPAMNNLGIAYEQGEGAAKDPEEAVQWYRLAAENGSAAGTCNLAQCYEYGTGVPQDLKTALGWYRKAAELGNAKAKRKVRELF